jgi:hypothetical protein
MKKQQPNTPKRLLLTQEKVRELGSDELVQVVGGLIGPCAKTYGQRTTNCGE